MKIRFWKSKPKLVVNHFRTDFPRKALVCAVDRPFFKPLNFKHQNQTEAVEIANVMHELGFQVDVVNHSSTLDIDYSKYDLMFGYGAAFENVFLKPARRLPKTILYMVGIIEPVWNRASLRRLRDVFQRRGAWLPGSSRIITGGTVGCEKVVDGLVVLGNAVIGDAFRAVTASPVHELPLFYLPVANASEIMKARDLTKTRNHFIWFSGSGLVHKGLDLALEAFRRHPELHLHVYGAIENEPDFVREFHHELHELPNIHVERWLAVESPEFKAALLGNAFIICPSSAEGCCSSVLNVCGNGGIIPVITRECGINLEDFGILVEDTTVEAVEAALLQAARLDDQELERRMRRAAEYIQAEHSLERYHQRMKAAVQSILNG